MPGSKEVRVGREASGIEGVSGGVDRIREAGGSVGEGWMSPWG